MIHLELKEPFFLFLLPCIYLSSLLVALIQCFDASFHLNNTIDLPLFLILKLLDLIDEIISPMLSLELLTHGKGYRILLECPIGLVRHLNLIANAKQK